MRTRLFYLYSSVIYIVGRAYNRSSRRNNQTVLITENSVRSTLTTGTRYVRTHFQRFQLIMQRLARRRHSAQLLTDFRRTLVAGRNGLMKILSLVSATFVVLSLYFINPISNTRTRDLRVQYIRRILRNFRERCVA